MSLIKRIGCATSTGLELPWICVFDGCNIKPTVRGGREGSAFALSNTLTIFCLNASKQGEKGEGVSNERAGESGRVAVVILFVGAVSSIFVILKGGGGKNNIYGFLPAIELRFLQRALW